MYRLFIRLFIFVVIVSLSLYIGVQWKLKQDLAKINDNLGPAVDFTYESSALSLTGNIILGGVDFYFQQQDINIAVNRLEYSSGSIFTTAFVASQFKQKELPEYLKISLDEVVVRLTPSLVETIAVLEQPSRWNSMAAAACGKIKSIGFNQYFAMGYDYLVFSTDFELDRDSYNGNLLATGTLEIEETSNIQYTLDVANVYESLLGEYDIPRIPVIESMNVRIKDTGYNRHWSEYCALKSNSSVSIFVEQHVRSVKESFQSVGIKMTPSGSRAYRDYLQSDSMTEITVEPQTSFSMADFGFYDESELRDILNLKLSINGKNIGTIFDNWSSDKLSQISFVNNSDEENVYHKKRFETVIVRRQYEQESIEKMAGFLGLPVRITKNDGRVYVGELAKKEANKVYIDTQRSGGIVQISVNLAQVKQLEVLRKITE